MGLHACFPHRDFLLHCECRLLFPEWLMTRASPGGWRARPPDPARASGQGMTGSRMPLETSVENRHFSLGCSVEGGPTAATHNPPVSVAYGCNPLLPVVSMQEFGDTAPSIFWLHRPDSKAGKLFLQRARVNISRLKATTVRCLTRLYHCSPKSP